MFQNRDDYGPRRLEIAVENLDESVITVTSATFSSERFTAPASWTRPTEIPIGSTRNLRVDLAPADCDADATAATVTIAFELPDETQGTATVTPTDPFDQVDKLLAQDCAAVFAERTVAITLGDAVTVEQRGDHPVALLDVTFTPTGEGEPVTIDEITRTILIKPASGEDAWPIVATFDATSEPSTVTLDIVPSNCRLHTVAEDKRGTYFPFSTNGSLFYIAASNDVKEQIYAYIAQYCGWDESTPLD